ncbi:MAG: AmmeMemoRadiSam system protein A, partial [Coriobacteriaceae bacterium]|nr:AmmeMemoRadiSam system protein A [Coriobacteriaceae bacterium]
KLDKVASGLPPELIIDRAGCFVSLKIDGQLRGCIGTLAPTRTCLAEEIIANAISAGTHDYRFSPVRPDELDELVYDVDVLSKPERIASEAELDTKRYGVIVSCDDGRRGVLLPDLDGIDTADEQVSIAARKGNIDLRRDDYHLERFEVVRHL